VILSKDVILKEQPDRLEVIKTIAGVIDRLGKLYLIPGWTQENAVILAEWVFDNYKYEALEDVISCLKNPPQTTDEHGRIESNWRLTPDRIQKWMAVQLEKTAMQRESEHNKVKNSFKEPIPDIDYKAYAKRIEEGKALQDDKSKLWYEDPEYKKFKAERMQQQLIQNKPVAD